MTSTGTRSLRAIRPTLLRARAIRPTLLRARAIRPTLLCARAIRPTLLCARVLKQLCSHKYQKNRWSLTKEELNRSGIPFFDSKTGNPCYCGMTLMATAVLVSRKTRSPSPEELDRSGIPFFGSKTGNPCISFSFFLSHTSTFQLLDKPWSQVSSLLPPRFLPSIFIAHRVQRSH